MRPLRPLLFAAALAVVAAARAASPDSATPYASLYRVIVPAKTLEQSKRLKAVPRIQSKLDGVAPEGIRLTIRAKSGDIAVPVARDGALDFPLRDDLLAENPPVETNQPKGSLSLTTTVELRLTNAPEVPAREIEAALAEADAIIARQAVDGGHPKVRGVEFLFPEGAGGVTVRGTTERLLIPDATGRVVLMRDHELAEPDARIAFAARPLQALPYLGGR
jgi:hypothetical protein